MKTKTAPQCNKCKVEMKQGQAIVNGVSGIPDFYNDAVVTISPDPSKVSLISCWKCPQCGKSIK